MGVVSPDRLAYQPLASGTFLSEQISHQQSASSTFLSEQTSTSHQPPAKRTGCVYGNEQTGRGISICQSAKLTVKVSMD
jgi:hypothetical protein